MKASELIEILKAAVLAHGDIPVFTWQEYTDNPCGKAIVETEPDEIYPDKPFPRIVLAGPGEM